MSNIHYCGVVAFIIGIFLLCFFMLFCGYFLGGRSHSRSKNVPFESGIGSVGDARIKFSIKFYLIAMVFVIFDVEGIYIYVWAISVRDLGWIGFFEIFVFIFVLVASLIYLIRVGALNWSKQSLKNSPRVNYFNLHAPVFLKERDKRKNYEIHSDKSSNGS